MKRKYKKSNNLKLFILLIMAVCLGSCKKYLDIKPDIKLEIPSTMKDCQALLADYNTMNNAFPFQDEQSADNYFLPFTTWQSLEQTDHDGYIWKADADVNAGVWRAGYKRVLNANQVLETLSKINPSDNDRQAWNTLKGSALFFRACSFYSLAQIWAKPYDKASAAQDPGIPIRLTPDITEKTDRRTVQYTYDRVLEDLKAAADLLPAVPPDNVTRKTTLLTRSAALAALARTYLAMGDYANAGANADACLQQYNTLMDYNEVQASGQPIAQFNSEVIFDATSGATLPLYFGKIDPALYASYQAGDQRRTVLFNDNGDGTFGFRGNYTGTPGYITFTGFATDEIYLIRAECYARAGNTTAAMADLNTLMQKRWDGTFVPFTAAGADEALALILQERRKELLWRGIRWTDLRRLNKDSRFAVTLTRNLNGQVYTLPPNDLRYVLLIPQEVLNRVNLPQNPR